MSDYKDLVESKFYLTASTLEKMRMLKDLKSDTFDSCGNANFQFYKLFDVLEKEIQELKEKLEKAVEVIKNASNYLDATYDIHTWKDEPEYQMMMGFREILKELEGGE